MIIATIVDPGGGGAAYGLEVDAEAAHLCRNERLEGNGPTVRARAT